MHIDEVASLKVVYKKELVTAISPTITVRAALREAPKLAKPTIKGVNEGHDLHFLYVPDNLSKFWDVMQAQTIA